MTASAFVSHSRKLVAIWSPKCACTTVARWFAGSVLELENLPEDSRTWLRDSGYVYDYRQSRHLVEDLGYRSVQFTRDPTSRIVSSFLNKFYIYRGQPLATLKSLEGVARALIRQEREAYPDRWYERRQFHGISFDRFLEVIALRKASGRSLDHHWDAQLPGDGIYIRPDFIVKQEAFEADLGEVNRVFGLESVSPGEHNLTRYPDDFVETDLLLNDMTTLRMLGHKYRLKQENLLTAANSAVISGLYSPDAEFFGYPGPRVPAPSPTCN